MAKTIGILVDNKMHSMIKICAAEKGMSIKNYIIDLCKKDFAEKEQEKSDHT